MIRALFRRFRKDEAGATALEFALLAVPLLSLTFGIVEFGRALFLQQSLTYATDKAARTLYLSPNATQSSLAALIADNVFLADPARLTVAVCTSTDAACGIEAGSVVAGAKARKLTVSYDFQTVIPTLIDALLPLKFERVVIVPK